MKNLLAIVAGVAAGVALICTASAQDVAPKPLIQDTTIVVVRHAEKGTDDPRDPSLSEAGQARAKSLAAALDGAEVTAVYTTQYRRTKETGEPLAKRFKLNVSERPITAANAAKYTESLVREVISGAQNGKTVVIVGHSNTVPELVKAFGGKAISPLTEDDYDRLFILVRPASGGPARLFQTRYGSPGAAQ